MKWLSLALVLAFAFVGQAQAAISVVAHTYTGGQHGGTTSGIDTTGATLLIIAVSGYNGSGNMPAATVSDSKGNTYTPLTSQDDSMFVSSWVRLYYCGNPSVGSGHTITLTGTNVYATVAFAAFSGVTTTSPFDTQNGNINSSSPVTISTGSVTPAEAGSLAVTVVSIASVTTIPTVSDGYTIIDSVGAINDDYQGFSLAWNTISSASNPTWTVTDPPAASTAIAVFKPGSAPPAAVGAGLLTLGVGN